MALSSRQPLWSIRCQACRQLREKEHALAPHSTPTWRDFCDPTSKRKDMSLRLPLRPHSGAGRGATNDIIGAAIDDRIAGRAAREHLLKAARVQRGAAGGPGGGEESWSK
jgi:hypothetical protein